MLHALDASWPGMLYASSPLRQDKLQFLSKPVFLFTSRGRRHLSCEEALPTTLTCRMTIQHKAIPHLANFTDCGKKAPQVVPAISHLPSCCVWIPAQAQGGCSPAFSQLWSIPTQFPIQFPLSFEPTLLQFS